MARYCGRKGTVTFNGKTVDLGELHIGIPDESPDAASALPPTTTFEATLDLTVDAEQEQAINHIFWWLRLREILLSHFSVN